MRHLFILLLIALLPLRGWSAEHMAVQMASSQLGVSAMPADCPMLAQAGTSDTRQAHAPGKSLTHCQSCQLCMTLAALPPLSEPAVAPRPQAPLAQHTDRFASADLLRAAKPPIS